MNAMNPTQYILFFSNNLREYLDYLAPQGSLDLPGPLHRLSWEQLQAQGPSDPQEGTEHLVNLYVCLS